MELQNKEMKIAAIRLKLPTDYGDLVLEVPCDIAMDLQVMDGGVVHHSINSTYQLVIPSSTLAEHGAFETNTNGTIHCQAAGTKFGFPSHVVRLAVDLKGWATGPKNYSVSAAVNFVKIINANAGEIHCLMEDIGYNKASVVGVTLKYK